MNRTRSLPASFICCFFTQTWLVKVNFMPLPSPPHPQIKEVSRRRGEVMNTRLINVTVPPFQCEVPGLQALTGYNFSVSCSNDMGSSPGSPWMQDTTTEGGGCGPQTTRGLG